MKVSIKLGFLIALFSTMSFAQTYQMSITNTTKTATAYEFDVYINSTGTSFYLTSYQCAVNFNNNLANSGTLSFSYIPKTSQITNFPQFGIGLNRTDGKIELTFASDGTPSVSITTTKKRIGRFRLQNSIAFANYAVNWSWDFSGKCNTIITADAFKNITNQSSHVVQNSPLKIILAAEKGYLANGATKKTKSGSLGTQVVYCTSNSSYIQFNVNIPKAGNWYAWGRFYYETNSTSANAFNLKLDGGSAKPFGNNNTFNAWHWDGDGISTSGAVKLALGYLTAGSHTVVISGREVGSAVMIDQLLLTPDGTFVPNDSNIKYLKETTDQKEVIADIPEEFELMQNYPNPFNPTTTIRYSLMKSSEVSLIVYDILGNEVRTLVNDIKDTGSYEVLFNAENLSSGVYIYILRAGNFTATKKLMLMK